MGGRGAGLASRNTKEYGIVITSSDGGKRKYFFQKVNGVNMYHTTDNSIPKRTPNNKSIKQMEQQIRESAYKRGDKVTKITNRQIIKRKQEHRELAKELNPTDVRHGWDNTRTRGPRNGSVQRKLKY